MATCEINTIFLIHFWIYSHWALIICRNYVVQYIFQLELSWAEIEVLEQLEGHYGDLSMQKYSSNVVERCLENAGEEQRARIIQELINHPRLDQIMQDPYGNYVVQTASRITKVSNSFPNFLTLVKPIYSWSYNFSLVIFIFLSIPFLVLRFFLLSNKKSNQENKVEILVWVEKISWRLIKLSFLTFGCNFQNIIKIIW